MEASYIDTWLTLSCDAGVDFLSFAAAICSNYFLITYLLTAKWRSYLWLLYVFLAPAFTFLLIFVPGPGLPLAAATLVILLLGEAIATNDFFRSRPPPLFPGFKPMHFATAGSIVSRGSAPAPRGPSCTTGLLR